MTAATPTATGFRNRWTQLIFCIICMALIANLQYGWTLFVNPIHDKMGWTKAAIQVAFTVFVLVETWLVPVEGWLVDRFGPRPVVAGGGILVTIAWIINSSASSLPMLYLGSALAGLGAGCVYGTCIGSVLKWFPDRRGLAAGLSNAGFGAGAAITVIPIANMIKSSGYQATFLNFALILGGLVCLLSLFMVKPIPPTQFRVSRNTLQNRRDYRPTEAIRTPVFWMIYLIFVVVGTGGLIATAQIAPIAKDLHIDKFPMHVFGTVLPLLALSMSIDSVVNGLTRPLSGLLSDKLGREKLMLLVFIGEGLALLGFMKYGANPYAFVIFAPMIYLFYGEIYAISSALAADTFGTKYASANAGAIYTAKGTSALMVPLASLLTAYTGNWNMVLSILGILCLAVALLSWFVLLPMRRRFIEQGNAFQSSEPEAAGVGQQPATVAKA